MTPACNGSSKAKVSVVTDDGIEPIFNRILGEVKRNSITDAGMIPGSNKMPALVKSLPSAKRLTEFGSIPIDSGTLPLSNPKQTIG